MFIYDSVLPVPSEAHSTWRYRSDWGTPAVCPPPSCARRISDITQHRPPRVQPRTCSCRKRLRQRWCRSLERCEWGQAPGGRMLCGFGMALRAVGTLWSVVMWAESEGGIWGHCEIHRMRTLWVSTVDIARATAWGHCGTSMKTLWQVAEQSSRGVHCEKHTQDS